jgi:hypothetical protein
LCPPFCHPLPAAGASAGVAAVPPAQLEAVRNAKLRRHRAPTVAKRGVESHEKTVRARELPGYFRHGVEGFLVTRGPPPAARTATTADDVYVLLVPAHQPRPYFGDVLPAQATALLLTPLTLGWDAIAGPVELIAAGAR